VLPEHSLAIEFVNDDGVLIRGRWNSYAPAEDDQEYVMVPGTIASRASEAVEMIAGYPDELDTDDGDDADSHDDPEIISGYPDDADAGDPEIISPSPGGDSDEDRVTNTGSNFSGVLRPLNLPGDDESGEAGADRWTA
jgi:hypothetical protein